MTELKVYVNPELVILDSIQEKMKCKVMDTIMPWISFLANGGMIWFALLCGLYETGNKEIAVRMLMALTLEAVICNLLLKPCVKRIRPCDINKEYPLLIKRPKDYGFPSGHAGASFACAAVLFLFHHVLWISFGIIASLIAFSRLYLYVHYPSDVISGILIGIICACIVFFLL